MSTGNNITKFYMAVQKRTDEWMTAGYPYRDAQERAWYEFYNGFLVPRFYLEEDKVLSFQEAKREGLVTELKEIPNPFARGYRDVAKGWAVDDLPPEN